MNLISSYNYRKNKEFAIMDFELSNDYSKNIILISRTINRGNRPSTDLTKFRGSSKKLYGQMITNATKQEIARMINLIKQISKEKPIQREAVLKDIAQGLACPNPNLNSHVIGN